MHYPLQHHSKTVVTGDKMRVTIGNNKSSATHRMLVLSPEDTVIDPLSSSGELAEFTRMGLTKTISIDALIGEVSEQELSDALQAGNYNIFLTIVHGYHLEDESGVVLSREKGWRLSGEQLGRYLAQHSVKVCVLMACDSESFAEQISSYGIPYVISVETVVLETGGKMELRNDVARRFTREFFKELATSNDIKKSYEYACSRVPEEYAANIRIHVNCHEPTDMEKIYTILNRIEGEQHVFDKKMDRRMAALTNAVLQLANALSLEADSDCA